MGIPWGFHGFNRISWGNNTFFYGLEWDLAPDAQAKVIFFYGGLAIEFMVDISK